MEDAKATNADKLRALELLDRLPAPDGRDFTLAEIEDELGEDGLDALFAEPMTIQHSAQLEARAILQNDERFNAEVQRVAQVLAEQAHREAHEARRRAREAERQLTDMRESQRTGGRAANVAEVVPLRPTQPDAEAGWPGRETPSWGVQPRPRLR
jgi:hypothetical protein